MDEIDEIEKKDWKREEEDNIKCDEFRKEKGGRKGNDIDWWWEKDVKRVRKWDEWDIIGCEMEWSLRKRSIERFSGNEIEDLRKMDES